MPKTGAPACSRLTMFSVHRSVRVSAASKAGWKPALRRQCQAAPGQYQHIAKLNNGLHILHASNSTGCSGMVLRNDEATVKMAVQRMRSRYRELLREEIAKTVATPAEIEDKIPHLFPTFGNQLICALLFVCHASVRSG